MLSKLTDIETGIAIPIRSIKIEMSIEKDKREAWATVVIPLEEIEFDELLTKLERVDPKKP